MEPTTHRDTVLPASIGQLTCLTQLKVGPEYANLPLSLPTSFFKLTLLESLTLMPFPTSFKGLMPLLGCKELVHLTIRVLSTEMADLPDFLLNFPKLTSLNLAAPGPGASAISENFGRLQLTSLILDFYKIRRLPESLGEMSSLKILDLFAEEGLKHLPASLGSLTGLEKLSLWCAELTTLPDSIGNLKHLTYILLDTCINLSTLPCSICELESLEELKIMFCKALTTLPESVGNLRSLKYLGFWGCESLLTLPNSITSLELHELMISRCEELVEPPVETLLQQFGRALTYVSEKRGLTIVRGQILRGGVEGEDAEEGEEEPSESETEEDNDSNVSGSLIEGDDEESE